MPKYLAFLPILLLTLGTISPITIAKPQPGTRIDRSTAPTPKYTGVVKQVDDIAQQITVRIEDKEGNGSGVIVAREGNTYSVMTAAHVVKEREGYSIITPTQERIVLKADQITILNKDLDIALLKFTSNQNYRIAKLANYQFQKSDFVFVSGFPGRDSTHRRVLSIGMIWSRDQTDFQARDLSSFSGGNNLVYSNLSLPGMSGGAVLDRAGRLVGINTGAENEEIITQDYKQEQINFGHALGIPISTILGLLSRGQITTQLKVTTTLPPQLIQSDKDEITQILLSTLSIPTKTSTGKQWLDYGNLLLRGSNDEQVAIVAFDRAISLLKKENISKDRDRQIALAYYGKGFGLGSQSKSREAVAAFSAAATIDPQFFQAWRYHGRQLKELRQYTEALTSYQKAIDLTPNNFVLYVELGDIYQRLKRYPEAINSYERAIQLKPQHPWIYANRGIVYTDFKQYQQALADYNQAIELDSQDAITYSNRGELYRLLKQYSQALADYNQAIKLNPKSANAYGGRGTTYSDQKQYPQALADFNQSIELKPQAVSYNNRGDVYRLLKQHSQALSDFNRAIELDDKYVLAYGGRGTVYAELKQYPQALSDYNRSIELDDKYILAYEGRGWVYMQQQKYPQALADSNRAIELNPQSEGAYLIQGMVYLQINQPDKAKTAIKKAAEIFQQKGDMAGYQRMIEVLHKLG